MAVMAAQARSLGFSLVFAAQDLPSMEKRIKQEAKSIVGNCNLKILGRIEDPTETKDFVEKHGGSVWVMETKGFSAPTNTVSGLFMSMPFHDDRSANYTNRQRVAYDHLRGQREGEAHLLFGDWAHKAQMFYAVPEKAKALRVHRFLPVPGVTKSTEARDRATLELTSRLKDKEWTAVAASAAAKEIPEVASIADAVKAAAKANVSAIEMGVFSVAAVAKMPPAPKSVVPGEEHPSSAPKNGKAAHAGYGVSDDFDAMDAPAAAHAPKATVSYAVEASAEDRAAKRAGLPPMYDGDEFAIENVEKAPEGSGYAATQSDRGFAGTDADLSAIIPEFGDEEEMIDFADIELPDNVKDVLAQSAQQINEGLRGKSATK
jgi:hypothetical protein